MVNGCFCGFTLYDNPNYYNLNYIYIINLVRYENFKNKRGYTGNDTDFM
jgi:hypothetical protein